MEETRLRKVRVAHIRDSCGMYGAERVILTLAGISAARNSTLHSLPAGTGSKSKKFIRNAAAMGIDVQPVTVRGRLDSRALLEVAEDSPRAIDPDPAFS